MSERNWTDEGSESPSVRRSDEDLDRVIASLTDASPSPAMRATIMRRIAEERAAAIRRREGPDLRRFEIATIRWSARVAFVAAAVLVLVTAGLWVALTPGRSIQVARAPAAAPPVTVRQQDRDTGNSRRIPGGTRDGQPGAAAVDAPRRMAVASPRHRSGVHHESVPKREDVAEQPAEATRAPVLAPIEVAPIPDPPPVSMTPMSMTPMSMKPIDIPDIDILPLDETGRPGRDPDKKQPGGPMSGTIR